MKPDAGSFDHFLSQTVTYGLAYVFLVAICFALVVLLFAVTWAAVNLIRKAPARLTCWIDNDIETKKAVATSANKLTESLGPIHVLVAQTHHGLKHALRAADAHVTRNPDQFDNDVKAHLDNAKEALGPELG